MAAGQNDPLDQPGSTPVPDLIERYRMRRDAWIAQADELARLRDEVRGSAEREAMEIVTAARRDVRKVIMEARRELLVLSAQVQAALGEVAAKTDSAALLHKAGITPEPDDLPALIGPGGAAFVAEDTVEEILNEVHSEMAALAADAKALPLQPLLPSRQIGSLPSLSAPVPQPHIEMVAETAEESATPPPDDTESQTAVHGLSRAASKALLSSPFPIDAVPVIVEKRLGLFVALFAVVGIVVAGITAWWVRNPETPAVSAASAATAPSDSLAATPPPAVVEAAPAASSATAPQTGRLSIAAEAVREVWVRTTVDGRTDLGRTLAAGQVIDLSANDRISIRAGDAGAIVVSVNRGRKQPLGRDGEVLTREFVVESGRPAGREPAPNQSVPAPAGRGGPAPPVASAPSSPLPAATVMQTNAAPARVANPFPPAGSAVGSTPVSQLASNAGSTARSGPATPLAAPPLPAPAASAAAPSSPANMVVAAARQWLDAYHRQDRAAMAALSTDNLLLADERGADERFPSGLSDVTRTLDRISVQVAADTAVLTAVMMEQSGSGASPHVSPISQVWVYADSGQWKVRQARFVSEARLNQIFR